jgi:hypothetical protein
MRDRANARDVKINWQGAQLDPSYDSAERIRSALEVYMNHLKRKLSASTASQQYETFVWHEHCWPKHMRVQNSSPKPWAPQLPLQNSKNFKKKNLAKKNHQEIIRFHRKIITPKFSFSRRNFKQSSQNHRPKIITKIITRISENFLGFSIFEMKALEIVASTNPRPQHNALHPKFCSRLRDSPKNSTSQFRIAGLLASAPTGFYKSLMESDVAFDLQKIASR